MEVSLEISCSFSCPELELKIMSFDCIKDAVLTSLAKWLSVRLRIKWLWVRVPLQSHNVICFVNFCN